MDAESDDAGEEEERTMDPIKLSGQVFEICFHPSENIIASGLINSRAMLHRYSTDRHEELFKLRHHTGSVRSVQFSTDGLQLFTGSADKSIGAVDVATGNVAWQKKAAHTSPINSILAISPTILASGCDTGGVCLWDVRTPDAPVAKIDVHTDFISAMTCDTAGANLLCTSGDATLSVIDLRTQKLAGRSDDQEDELLSVMVIKGGRKVVCGSQNGILLVWSWGVWGDCSDRFPGHPHSIDTLAKVDEETLLTGSSDGLIRIVTVQPNKFLGVMGNHDDFPVEQIQLTWDRKWIGSVTHDNVVRFWDAADLDEEEEEGEEGEHAVDDVAQPMDQDSSDDDSDDSSDGGGKRGKAGNPATGRKPLASAAESFYSDL